MDPATIICQGGWLLSAYERSRPDNGKCAENVKFGFVADRKAVNDQVTVHGFAVRN